MFLRNVTITGMDQDTDLEKLLEVNQMFPFVEWGILFSSGKPKPRYPGRKWVEESTLLRKSYIKLAFHVCGKISREFFQGNINSWHNYVPTWSFANRIQLNYNITKNDPDFPKFRLMLVHYLQRIPALINQHNKSNEHLWEEFPLGIKHEILFDASGGRGIAPETWPDPIAGKVCGYSGGISAENIDRVLQSLDKKINGLIWIDMETGVRTDDKLDIEKVKHVLRACEPYVWKDKEICPTPWR